MLQGEPRVGAPSPGGGHEPAPRPTWHWVPLGAFATFLAWLPLSMGAESVVRGLVDSADAGGAPIAAAGVRIVAGHALAFFVGAVVGGVLVGKLSDSATRKHAALGGALASVLGWLIAATQGTPGGALTWGLLLLLMLAIGGGGGALGGALGLRLRAPRAT